MLLWIYLFLDIAGNIVPESNESRSKIFVYHLRINDSYTIQQYKSLDLKNGDINENTFCMKHYPISSASTNILFSPLFFSNFL